LLTPHPEPSQLAPPLLTPSSNLSPCPAPNSHHCQAFADALPYGQRPKPSAPAAAAHVARYQELNRQLGALSLQLHQVAPGAGGVTGGDAGASELAGAGAAGARARARWQRAVAKQVEVDRAKRGSSGALGSLVGGILRRGDLDATRWCAALLLLRQLGVGLERLQDCMGAWPHWGPWVGGAGGGGRTRPCAAGIGGVRRSLQPQAWARCVRGSKVSCGCGRSGMGKRS
jgi:hypothetical protein